MRRIFQISKFRETIKRHREYVRDAVFLSLPQAISIGIALVTLPPTLYALTPSDFGRFQFIMAIQAALIAFTASNITLGAKKGIANGLSGTILYAFQKRLLFFLPLGLFALGLAAYLYFFSLKVIEGSLFFVIGLYTIFGYLPQVSYPEFLIAKKEFRTLSFWQLLSGIFIPILSMISAVITKDVVVFASVQIGLTSVIGIVAFLHTLHKYDVRNAYKKKQYDPECRTYGIKLMPSEILLTAANQASSFIIGPFFGFASLATYSIASKIDASLRGFLRVSYNLFYSDFSKYEISILIREIKSRLYFIVAFSIGASIFALIVGASYINIFLPREYAESLSYFFILSLAFPAFIVQSILRTVLESSLNHRQINRLTILINTIRILLIALLGWIFGVFGIVFATTILTWIELVYYYRVVILTKIKESDTTRA